tara:strand:- start:2277 stop:2546 length:270 start_codon:yes stop_codon:yes gene_type:complete
MAKVENLKPPSGWLIDPHNKWAIHFDFKNVSNDHMGTDVTIDMWGFLPSGKPMEFKSRRKVTKKESIKTWKQLIESNWVEFDIKKIKTA